MKTAYICYPYRGKLQPENRAMAEHYARLAIEKGYSPIVVHTMIPFLFGDDQPGKGIQEWCFDLVRASYILIICGSKISVGMQDEIELAKKLLSWDG